jgi:NitT/TauT family transport system substrate-binding protein
MDRNPGEKNMGGQVIRRSRMLEGLDARMLEGKNRQSLWLGGWAVKGLKGKQVITSEERKLGRAEDRKKQRAKSFAMTRKAFNINRQHSSTLGTLAHFAGTALLLLITLLAVFPTLCFSAEQDTPLTYRLKWLFNTSVVGDLWTESQGAFSDQGLEVTVKAGGPERDAIKELELGYADFGVASADQVIRALAKGSPVVVICQLFQENPLQWIYRSDHVTLQGLADLKGKKIGVTFGGNDETILRALLAEGGIRERDVTLFSVRYDYTPFYRKQVHIWPVYRNAQGLILAQKLGAEGEPVAFFDPSRFGVKFVANSVVTSREMAENRPETVRRFLAALLEGWRQAMAPENEDRAIAVLQEYDKDTTRDMLRQQLWATRQIVQPATGIAIGGIDTAAWRQTEAIMLGQGLIPEAVDIDRALLPYFMPESPEVNKLE